MGIVEQHIRMAKKHNEIIEKKYRAEINHSTIQSKIYLPMPQKRNIQEIITLF